MEKNKKKLSGSMAAKITAFFLLAVSFVIGVVGIAGCAVIYGPGMGTEEGLVKTFLWDRAQTDLDFVTYEYLLYNRPDALEGYFEHSNASAEVYVEHKRLWSNYDGKETEYVYRTDGRISGKLEKTGPGQDIYLDRDVLAKEAEELEYTVYLYIDDAFPLEDVYKTMASVGTSCYNMRGTFPGMVIGGILMLFFCFIFLMCSAGHRNGREGIVPSVISEFAFDFVTVIFGCVALGGVFGFLTFADEGPVAFSISLLVFGTLEAVWGTLFCMEFATRMKMGKFWQNTLIYLLLKNLVSFFKWIGRMAGALFRGFPLVLNVAIVFFAAGILELFLGLVWGIGNLPFLWLLEKALLLPVLLYIALAFKKLQKGSEALAEGNLNYHINTSQMLFAMKEHGENLNRIGEGIAAAVEERMRSERLKTELITNVSHDLKTPLTSIINYAELLGEESLEPEKVSEYAGVLLRQSKRLKKLLEDLVEASKATTGNLEVKLQPCQLGVILSQAVGEFEQRFAEKGLELITRQPENEVRIAADGRHLWRTFDNLMNNIYKYAQENTRVYLSVEPKGNFVEIIFRNMSRYPLEISGEELQERFVRGDKSRHMEGNGLGLSIAKSLVELQEGVLEIVTDGDLFKVILRFPILQQEGAGEGSCDSPAQ